MNQNDIFTNECDFTLICLIDQLDINIIVIRPNNDLR